MGLFSWKKKKKLPEMLDISAGQLEYLAEEAKNHTVKNVNEKCYIFGTEIMFDYNDKTHIIGVGYDKKRAKTENNMTFSEKYMTVYLDKEKYSTIEELFENVKLDGKQIREIQSGIIVGTEYKSLLNI